MGDRREFTWRALVVAVIAAATVIFLWAVHETQIVLLLAFAGILLGILLRGLGNRLAHLLPRMPEDLGLVTVVALIGAAFAIVGYVMAPHIATQFDELVDTIPEAFLQLRAYLEQFDWAAGLVSRMEEGFGLFSPEMLGRAGQIFTASVNWIAYGIIVLFVGLFTAAQPDLYRRGLITLVPPPRRQRAGEVLDALGHTLWRWLMGQLVAMLTVGIVSTIGLILLDVPLGFLLGLLAGLFEFVPYIGPLVAGGLWVLIALTQSPELALYVLIFYLAVQGLESYILGPFIVRWTVLIPPALTLLVQLLFGVLFGVFGVILATPLVAAGMTLVKQLYVEDILGESVHLPGGDASDS